MNPGAHPDRHAPDLDLAQLDFAAAYEKDPSAALAMLRALLLDRVSCQGRVELLRHLEQYARAQHPELVELVAPRDFDTELRLLAQGTVAQALTEGAISPERLAALTRDPAALLRAHRLLLGEPDPPPRREDLLKHSARWLPMLPLGASPSEIVAAAGLPADSILEVVCTARDLGWLHVRLGDKFASTAAPESPAREKPLGLLELLQRRSDCLRHLTVIEIPRGAAAETRAERMSPEDWKDHINQFGYYAAPVLIPLLASAARVGLAWGQTVNAAIEGVKRARGDAPPPRKRPLSCVATVGELVGEQKVRPESSSSTLASRLCEAINGNWDHVYPLRGVQAFIGYLDNKQDVDVIKKQITRFPSWQAIFGGGESPGVIDDLDGIMTSCNHATHGTNRLWSAELQRQEIAAETLDRITYGNIGGVFLPRPNLRRTDQILLDDITHRWTGITLEHYRRCARRTPGVILLAVGGYRADLVYRCVEAGIVSELIIDDDLATALWDQADPEQRYHQSAGRAAEVGVVVNRVS